MKIEMLRKKMEILYVTADRIVHKQKTIISPGVLYIGEKSAFLLCRILHNRAIF